MRVEPKAMLVHNGVVLRVVRVHPTGVELANPVGSSAVQVTWSELMNASGLLATPTSPDLSFEYLNPLWREQWANLKPDVQQAALERLGDVLEIETGFRLGFADLALPGEPKRDYDPSRTTRRQRVQNKAREVMDRRDSRMPPELRDRRSGGTTREKVSEVTVYRWLKRYQEEGLLGLVDGRAGRKRKRQGEGFPEYRQALEDAMREDGSESSMRSNAYYMRRARETVLGVSVSTSGAEA